MSLICLSCIFPCTCFYFEYIGFGGQKFQIDMMPKVRTIRDMCPHMNVEVDGGLALDTIDAESLLYSLLETKQKNGTRMASYTRS